MTKTYKTVLRSSLVMLSLLALAVVSSGVAQAQDCIARAISLRHGSAPRVLPSPWGPSTWRARKPEVGLGFNAIPAMLEITVKLNTRITSAITDTRVVEITDDAVPTDILGHNSR